MAKSAHLHRSSSDVTGESSVLAGDGPSHSCCNRLRRTIAARTLVRPAKDILYMLYICVFRSVSSISNGQASKEEKEWGSLMEQVCRSRSWQKWSGYCRRYVSNVSMSLICMA